MHGPAIVKAFNQFESDNPQTFSGTAEGQYLRNRLERAFQAGIKAAEEHARLVAMRKAGEKIQGYFDGQV